MSAQNNAAPVIIKRKKIVAGGGHHGGAWKVAYADFVTAMMAFFMLMWLLNATTEKQRKGIADYFNPTIPINRISGGGDGSFGGESVFSEEQIAQSGTGASAFKPSSERQARGQTGNDVSLSPEQSSQFDAIARKIEEELLGIGGESLISEALARHVVTRVTDEGLIVEIFDTAEAALFKDGTAEPNPPTVELAAAIAHVFSLATNQVAINGHIRSLPEVLRSNPAWDLSAGRAMEMRRLVESAGLDPDRIQRVTGFADRRPAADTPIAPGNNRIELILLRQGV